MRRTILFFFLTAATLGQTFPIRVSPDDAAKHLLKQLPPIYPPLAEATRIQGTVILEIRISESGKTSFQRKISGHPMLVDAAINAVTSWKYQPFELAGKPVSVVTVAMVTFGSSGRQPTEALAEMQFQHEFWTAVESAEVALGGENSAFAAQELKKAEDLLVPVSIGRRHLPERWQWATAMGHLCLAQRNFDEAEKYYKQALELRPTDDKDAPEIAATFAGLGNLYTEEKRYDLARDYMTRSVTVYEKNLKKVGSGDLGGRETYSRAIAYQSWSLSKLAAQQNDGPEFGKHCRKVLEFRAFLSASDQDSFVSTCQQALPNPTTKN
jgi:TonB family protein